MHLWAGVSFVAQGGQTADFLQRAANQNFKLRHIRPVFGGVSAHCAAGKYFALRKLAKSYHLHLRVVRRHGLYFRLRHLFRHKGVWCGGLAFVLFLVCNQNLVWSIDNSDLTIGQQARVETILWESFGIAPGAYVSQELLASAESAIMTQTDDFSWISLNFTGGRLTIEASAAAAVPEIAVGAQTDLVASSAGEIVSINVRQGTSVVAVGQTVTIGDVLISASRLEYDEETLVYEPTAGQVMAVVSSGFNAGVLYTQMLNVPAQPTQVETNYSFFVCGHLISIPDLSTLWGAVGEADAADEISVVESNRMWQLSWLGFSLPITVLEENCVYYELQEVVYTPQEALELARLACSEKLYASFPDAEILSWTETVAENNSFLILQVQCEVLTDICSLQE